MAGLVAGGLVAGTSLLVAAPAYADPGDASAVGAAASLDVDVAGIVIDLDASVGDVSVTGSGTDTSEEEDYTLVDALLADITVGAVSTSASSDATGSEATSEIADVDAELLGLDLLTVDAATAEVTCPTGGPATAEATLAGLTLLGDAAEITADTPEVSATTGLGVAVGGIDLSALDLTVTVTQVETATDDGAAAISLLALVTLDGTLGAEVFDSEVVATIVLASATCEAPLAVPVTATAITPQTGPTTGGQTVTITGSGFGPDTTVDFGANPATDVVVNAAGTSLTAVTPAGAAGPTTVSVANPGGVPATLPYTYVEPAATTLTPLTGPEYGGTTVTISGSGLGTVTGVDFGGDAATIVSVNPDGTQVVVTTPPGTGTVDVTLTLAGGSTITTVQDFTYLPVTVTEIEPDSGPSAGGSTVVITGEGLGGTTGVTFGGTPGTIVGTPTDTEVVVTTPPGAVGPVDVVIQLPGDDEVVDDGFTYTDDAPLTVTGLTPDAGPTGGGQTVTITGTGFTDDTTVSFGPNEGTDVTVNDDGTSLTVVTPPGTAGATTVTVATPGDTATLDYTYLAPTVSDISPAAGPAAGGQTVVITGDGLGGATDVLFDGVPGTIVGTPTDTEIVVVTPPGAAGPADVVIVLPGDDAVIGGGYVYLPAPTAGSVSPGQGPASGGTVVIVDGGGFVPGATTVTICGVTIPAGQVRVNEAGTQLRFTTPPCAVGAASIVVTTPGGSSDPLGFRYTAAATASAGNGGGSLASTGADPAPLVGAGLGLLLIGLLGMLTAFVVRSRKRTV